MSVLPDVWNTIKNLVTLIPGEVNVPLVLSTVVEVELAGGGFDKIFTALLAKATDIFPDPTFRPFAILILTELHKIAAAPPTQTPVIIDCLP